MSKLVFRYHGPDARPTIGEREMHCGDCFTVQGTPVRLEHHSGEWLLLGLTPAHAAWWDGVEVSNGEVGR